VNHVVIRKSENVLGPIAGKMESAGRTRCFSSQWNPNSLVSECCENQERDSRLDQKWMLPETDQGLESMGFARGSVWNGGSNERIHTLQRSINCKEAQGNDMRRRPCGVEARRVQSDLLTRWEHCGISISSLVSGGKEVREEVIDEFIWT
jgi:hypothetical protein